MHTYTYSYMHTFTFTCASHGKTQTLCAWVETIAFRQILSDRCITDCNGSTKAGVTHLSRALNLTGNLLTNLTRLVILLARRLQSRYVAS